MILLFVGDESDSQTSTANGGKILSGFDLEQLDLETEFFVQRHQHACYFFTRDMKKFIGEVKQLNNNYKTVVCWSHFRWKN